MPSALADGYYRRKALRLFKEGLGVVEFTAAKVLPLPPESSSGQALQRGTIVIPEKL